MTPPVQPAATKVEETVVRHLHEQLQHAAQVLPPVRRGPAGRLPKNWSRCNVR